jgi:geranylgeranyl diphosphate synthase, type I
MTTLDIKTEPRSTHEMLAWSRTTVEPALRAAVNTLSPSMRRIAGYHFGWWNEHGQPYPAPKKDTGGKAIRPTLVLLSAQAVGGVAATTVPAPLRWNWHTTSPWCMTT